MNRHPHRPESTPRKRRRRTPFIVKLLAFVGFVTLMVLLARYVVVPVLVMLEGVV